jgi:ATP-dependent protease HslVU (ClpYQ) peptidase subunit
MSIIVAVRKHDQIVMAADTLTCFGDAQRIPASNATTPKLQRLGDALVGASGWGVYDRILDAHLAERPVPDLGSERAIFAFFLDLWRALHDRFNFVNDQAQSKDSPFGDLDSSFLVASRAGMFKVSSDLDVSRFERYYAIGSGAEYALGAMHACYDDLPTAEDIARRGVEAAIAFDVYCDGEITVEAVADGG